MEHASSCVPSGSSVYAQGNNTDHPDVITVNARNKVVSLNEDSE